MTAGRPSHRGADAAASPPDVTLADVAGAGAPAAGADFAGEIRLLVLAVLPDSAAAEVAAQASSLLHQPVRHLSAMGAGWHALAVPCRSVADGVAARQRLQGARHLFAVVEDDTPRRRLAP